MRLAVICNRGGHLQDAIHLIEQMGMGPKFLVTTKGPDVDFIKKKPEFLEVKVCQIPEMFTWKGTKRRLSITQVILACVRGFLLAVKTRPDVVISTGASDVFFYCLFSRILRARIYHVECLCEVTEPSMTGKLLRPICSEVYVQWEELLKFFPKNGRYAGWVL